MSTEPRSPAFFGFGKPLLALLSLSALPTTHASRCTDGKQAVDLSSQFQSVKDQGDMGTCYAFTAAGALESAYFRATGRKVSIDEAYLLALNAQQDTDTRLQREEPLDGGPPRDLLRTGAEVELPVNLPGATRQFNQKLKDKTSAAERRAVAKNWANDRLQFAKSFRPLGNNPTLLDAKTFSAFRRRDISASDVLDSSAAEALQQVWFDADAYQKNSRILAYFRRCDSTIELPFRQAELSIGYRKIRESTSLWPKMLSCFSTEMGVSLPRGEAMIQDAKDAVNRVLMQMPPEAYQRALSAQLPEIEKRNGAPVISLASAREIHDGDVQRWAKGNLERRCSEHGRNTLSEIQWSLCHGVPVAVSVNTVLLQARAESVGRWRERLIQASDKPEDKTHALIATGIEIDESGESYLLFRNSWGYQGSAFVRLPFSRACAIREAQVFAKESETRPLAGSGFWPPDPDNSH